MAWRGPWLAVLVAASALAGCAAPQPPGSRADLQERRAELQRAVADDPQSFEPRIRLIRILFRLGDGVAAEAAGKATIDGGGNRAVLRPLLARAYAMQGDGRRALPMTARCANYRAIRCCGSMSRASAMPMPISRAPAMRPTMRSNSMERTAPRWR